MKLTAVVEIEYNQMKSPRYLVEQRIKGILSLLPGLRVSNVAFKRTKNKK